MKKNVAVLLTTLLLIFITGELVARYLQHTGTLPNYTKGNITAQPNKVRPPKYIHSSNPILYLEHDTNSPGINRWGTRDPDFSQEKEAGVYRVAVIGDSVSFGYGVAYEDSYPYFFQTLLNQNIAQYPAWKKVEVVNFAVSGYGVEAYLEMYRTKVRFFHPDLVLIGYVQNDPSPTSAVDQAVKAMMKSKSLRLQLARYSQFAAWLYIEWEKVSAGMASKSEWDYFQRDDVLAHTSDILKTFHRLLEEDNAEGIVLIFPYLLDFDKYPLGKVHSVLSSTLQNDKFPVCDLLPIFLTRPAKSIRLQDDDVVHLNASGNRLTAEAAYQCLASQASSKLTTPINIGSPIRPQ